MCWSVCRHRYDEVAAHTPPTGFSITKETLNKCQAGFFAGIVVPLFEALATALPGFAPTVEHVRENGRIWAELAAA
jgi:hypothetical protein|eukprot:SAG25_NODE_62_length_17948_cov_8.453975_15_plen_76_part_00